MISFFELCNSKFGYAKQSFCYSSPTYFYDKLVENMAKRLSSFPKNALIRWKNYDRTHVLVSDTATSSEHLIEGECTRYKVKDGFSINGGTTTELADYQVISTARKSLILVLLLEGKLNFGYDNLRFTLDATHSPQGVLVNLTKPVTFRRILHKNNTVTKLNIVTPVTWVAERSEKNSVIEAFTGQHMANCPIEINKAILQLAYDITNRGTPEGLLEKLHIETLTQRLLLNVFEQVLCSLPNEGGLSEKGGKGNSQGDHALDHLVSYIEANLDRELSAKELIEFAAMSESNLQRKFKTTLGCSVQSYIRRRKLEVARLNLEIGAATITEAAYNAGYKHPSNFTNAFKKTFGYPPAEVNVQRGGKRN